MKPNWTFRWPLCAGLAGAIGGAIVLPFVAFRQAQQPMFWVGAAALALMGCGGLGLAACARGRMGLAAAALVAACAMGMSTAFRIGRRLTPEVAVANAIARLAPRDAPLAEYECPECILYLKLDRLVIFLHSLDAVREYLNKPGPRHLLVRHDLVDGVTPLAPEEAVVLGSWPVGNRGTRVDLLMWGAAPAHLRARRPAVEDGLGEVWCTAPAHLRVRPER